MGYSPTIFHEAKAQICLVSGTCWVEYNLPTGTKKQRCAPLIVNDLSCSYAIYLYYFIYIYIY